MSVLWIGKALWKAVWVCAKTWYVCECVKQCGQAYRLPCAKADLGLRAATEWLWHWSRNELWKVQFSVFFLTCAHFWVAIKKISSVLSIRNNTKSFVSARVSQKKAVKDWNLRVQHHVLRQPYNQHCNPRFPVWFSFLFLQHNSDYKYCLLVCDMNLKRLDSNIQEVRIPRLLGVAYKNRNLKVGRGLVFVFVFPVSGQNRGSLCIIC